MNRKRVRFFTLLLLIFSLFLFITCGESREGDEYDGVHKISGKFTKESDDIHSPNRFAGLRFYDVDGEEAASVSADYFGSFSVFLPAGTYYVTLRPFDTHWTEKFILVVLPDGTVRSNMVLDLDLDNPAYLKTSREIMSKPADFFVEESAYYEYLYENNLLKSEMKFSMDTTFDSGSSYTKTYTYNRSGKVKRVSFDSTAGEKGTEEDYLSEYFYFRGRLVKENKFARNISPEEDLSLLYTRTYSYDKQGNVTGLACDFPGTSEDCYYEYLYEGSFLIEEKKYIGGIAPDAIVSYEKIYSYDDNKNIIGMAFDTVINDSGLEKDYFCEFTYRDMRLLQKKQYMGELTGSGEPDNVVTYTYDKSGNRTGITRDLTDDSNDSYFSYLYNRDGFRIGYSYYTGSTDDSGKLFKRSAYKLDDRNYNLAVSSYYFSPNSYGMDWASGIVTYDNNKNITSEIIYEGSEPRKGSVISSSVYTWIPAAE
ncbi:MAG: hypothetical protein GY754_07190 [bacterium]|nr:hypothetical protein [bacterium]